VKRLHALLGLLVFSQLVIYGIAGLTAAVQTHRERPKTVQTAHYLPFHADPMATDQQVAVSVYRSLDLPFTRPMPDWFLRRTPDHHLLLDFYQINGIHRVTLLENEGRLRIEEIRNSPWLFLEDLHATTGEDGEHFRLIRIWGAYNQFAMWSLIGMTLSGLYLWGVARRGVRWTQVCLGAGTGLLLILYGVLR
jgi:hypothetical protein